MEVKARRIGEEKFARGDVQPRGGGETAVAQFGGQFADRQFGRVPKPSALDRGRVQLIRAQLRQPHRPDQPVWLRVRPEIPRRIEICRRAGGRGEVGGKPDVARVAPRRPSVRRGDVQLDDECVDVARVAVDGEVKLRRAGEMDLIQRVGKFLQLRLQRATGLPALENFPVSDFRGVGDFAVQRQFRAREVGLEIVQRPCVIRLKTQIGLDVVERERVRRRERPEQPALP